MNKKILILLVVLVLLGIGFYTFNKKEAQAPAADSASAGQHNPRAGGNSISDNPSAIPVSSSTPTTQAGVNGSTGPSSTSGVYSGGGETTGSDMQVVEVDFDGTVFTPKVTEIKRNDYVFFKNKSKVNFFPASDPYPSDTGYPAFNAGKPIVPGAQFKFQFTKVGKWGYHDDLHPSIIGTVNVSK